MFPSVEIYFDSDAESDSDSGNIRLSRIMLICSRKNVFLSVLFTLCFLFLFL